MKPFQYASGRLPSMRAVCLWVFVAVMFNAPFAAAQSPDGERRCFGDDPESAVCVDDAFLAFWENHGGIGTFGKPVAPAATIGHVAVQYFEKARLESHPNNPRPYHVLLGRIGEERLRALGRATEPAEVERAAPDCRFFAATGHHVCGKFLEYWRSHGLQLDEDPAILEAESLALLGLPLTTAAIEASPSGAAPRTQWFERGKLIENAGVVSLALLGRELVVETPAASESTPTPASPVPITVAQPAPAPEPIRRVAFPTVPCNRNVPPPANGLQAWVITEGDQMIVCVRLILEGDAVVGANALVYRQYGGQTLPTIGHTTGLGTGVADFIFYTGGSLGRPSRLEAVASYRGVTYRVQLSP